MFNTAILRQKKHMEAFFRLSYHEVLVTEMLQKTSGDTDSNIPTLH